VTGVTPGNCIAGAEVEEEDSSGLWLEVTKVAMVCCVTMPGMVIIWLDRKLDFELKKLVFVTFFPSSHQKKRKIKKKR